MNLAMIPRCLERTSSAIGQRNFTLFSLQAISPIRLVLDADIPNN